MEVGMMQEILTPGVQDGQNADFMRTKVPGIGGHLGNRLAGRLEQQAIHQALVL
jgi:hypothetical protein